MNDKTISVAISQWSAKSSPLSASFSPPSQSSPVSRTELYKNSDKNPKQLRRRRSETMVELRKQKKVSDADRRRNITLLDQWSDNEDFNEEEEIIDLNINQMIDLLRNSDVFDIPVKYIRHLRKRTPIGVEMSCADNKQILELLTTEDISKLINCITNEKCSMALLNEVVALLAQLCSGDKEQTIILVNLGIVPNLLTLLSYDNLGVVEQTVFALSYIWNSCPEIRDQMNRSKFLTILVGLIDSETSVSPSKYVQIDSRIGLVRALSWALFIICQNRDEISYTLSLQFIPYFLKLLKYNDNGVKTNVLKTLSITTERMVTTSEDDNSPILKMVQSVVSNDQLFDSIFNSLAENEDEVVLNAIQIIGNIVSWGESYTQIVIQAKTLQNFSIILTHPKSKVQREGAFTVSNITAGNLAQIQAVIDANLIPLIVELLYMGDYKTQVEASHVLLNISAIGSMNQIYYLLNTDNSVTNMDVIDAMVVLLTSQDASVINNCLQFYNNLLIFGEKAKILNSIIKRCGISSVNYHLDSLQSHKNTQISILAIHIVEKFFSRDSSFEEDSTFNTSLALDERLMETNISF